MLSSEKTAINETDMVLPLLEKVKARRIFFITKPGSVRGTICLSVSLPSVTSLLSYLINQTSKAQELRCGP